MKTAYTPEQAQEFFWFNFQKELKCIRIDGDFKVVKRYIDALEFFNKEPEMETIIDTDNEF